MYETASDFGRTRVVGIVGGLLDRYMHTHYALSLKMEDLLPLYLPLETYLLEDTLPALVLVPILWLKFEAPKFRINDDVWVEELSDDLLLARSWHGRYGHSDNDLVESAATHALFISGRSIENYSWLDESIMQPESYPVETIDTFFAALRIATDYPTGYAQMLTLPLGWASGYTANLPSLQGPTVKNYPLSFDHGGWNDEVPTVSFGDAKVITETFANLRDVSGTMHARKVGIAMHRLNLSAMRATEEDGVIDAMIAIEALLSDGRQEMTHKIAMRLAALYKLVERSRATQVFTEMKHIYNFRSQIVHGGANLDKYRNIERGPAIVATVDAAVDYLRAAFAVLIKNPALLDPTRIDTFLLTDQL